jgi:hypothetical protein
MIQQRKDHKLSEWRYVIDEFRKLPYAKELLFLNEEE